MKKEFCGYIVLTPGLNSKEHFTDIDSNEIKNYMVGVGTVEEACKVAKELVEKGVTSIELCSGFNAELAETVYNSINGTAEICLASILFSKK